MTRFALTVLALVLFSAVASQAEEDKPTEAAVSKKAPAEAKLAIESWAGLQKFAKSRKDRLVVVDVWSTWCRPCLRELPHLVALQKSDPKRIEGVTFCLDYNGAKGTSPKSLAPNVRKALTAMKATGTSNFLCSDEDELVYGQLDLGSVPAVLVYRDGKLLKRFDNDTGAYGSEGFTYEKHVNPYVRTLLAE